MVTCQRVLYITHQQIQQNYKKYKSNKIIKTQNKNKQKRGTRSYLLTENGKY